MMVDIDHFKRVNDMYGHAVGDELLKRVACMLVETIKCARAEASWVVARIGGEEFAVLIMGAQAAEVVALAARICRHAPLAGVHVEGNFVRATVSIGIAMRGAGQSLDAVMRSADKAAYEAKRAGRNRFVMAEAADSSQQMETQTTSQRELLSAPYAA
jgi:diguanylate cyclase (GGDEF)-like protein